MLELKADIVRVHESKNAALCYTHRGHVALPQNSVIAGALISLRLQIIVVTFNYLHTFLNSRFNGHKA